MPAVLSSERAAAPYGTAATTCFNDPPVKKAAPSAHLETTLRTGNSVADGRAAAAAATSADAAQLDAATASAPATGWSPAGVRLRNWARLPLGLVVPAVLPALIGKLTDALPGLAEKWAVKRWA
ncbi:hypothetical protein [Pseudarthrobacter sulfonivorans]|uniref:hypothetical protein n=1 Tax=Pseudarthrobacter sulfonivorans TaxID=121292 RepID=UPI0021048556|nr:hypothetical protein [Pseudarthrobacter sulfonivorans]